MSHVETEVWRMWGIYLSKATGLVAGLIGPMSILWMLLPHLVQVEQQVHPADSTTVAWIETCVFPAHSGYPRRGPEGSFPYGTNWMQSELLSKDIHSPGNTSQNSFT